MTLYTDHSSKENGTWKDRLFELERSVCEGLQTDNTFPDMTNLYGRPLKHLGQNNLSYLSGLALCGLRTNAMIDNAGFENSLQQIRMAIRQHLPMTIHIDKSPDNEFERLPSNPELLPFSDSIQFVPSSAQEVLDFALIGHKASEFALTTTINQVFVTGNGNIKEVSNKDRVLFLGNPEERMESPTPSQRMIFGKNRRRIPQWFNYDFPAQLGSEKDVRSLGLEMAGRKEYFTAHLKQILSDCFGDFESISGRKHGFVTTLNTEKSPYLIISLGCNPDLVVPVLNELENSKIKTGFVNINVINPFPDNELRDLIKNKKAVTILEPMCENQDWLVSRVQRLTTGLKNPPQILTGYRNGLLKIIDLLACATNMTASRPKSSYYCGIKFTQATSDYPKHQVMLQEISRNYPHLEESGLKPEGPSSKPQTKPGKKAYSHLIKQYRDLGAPFSHLSRFRDDTSLFYQDNSIEELVADPFQNILSVPAASATLKSMADIRESLPSIDPVKCTACGSCMVHCPYTAMPSVALGLEDLLRSGMDMATASGVQIVTLIPHVKNIAKTAGSIISEWPQEDDFPQRIEILLEKALDKLEGQMKLDDEKLELFKKEYTAVVDSLRGLPITISDIIYRNPEVQEKGSGQIFSIAIDPDACTGCGLCVEACDDEAIEMVQENEDLFSSSKRTFDIWDKLPDTSSDTINNLLYEKDYNSFSALMLSRNFYHGLTGGEKVSDTPSRQMVHLITTLTESLIQPGYAEFVKKIDTLANELSVNIHTVLSESLPTENFDNILKAISTTDGDKVPFDEIISNIDKEDRLKQVDATSLKRKIELLDSLKGLKWSLMDGPTGAGRARMGMSISGKERFAWSSQYPHNPFISPVLTYQDEFTSEIALGLMDGQLRNIEDNVKLIRRAALEAKNKYQPREHDKEIAKLSWKNFGDEERKMVPPLLLILEQRQISENSLKSIASVLASQKPIKIIVIDGQQSSPDTEDLEILKYCEILSAISLRKTFVYQGGMAHSQSLFDGLLEGLNSQSPALIRVFVPDLDLHESGPISTSDLSLMACNSRSFPTLKFNPEKYRGFINTCLSIDDNPAHESTWLSQSIKYKEGGEEKTKNFDVTWADWAFTLNAWKSHFTLLSAEDREYIPVSEYISSDNPDKTPVIFRVKDSQLVRYAVSEEIIKRTILVRESWDMLRELSGTLTEFPEKLSESISAQLKVDFDDELQKIKAEYDKKLRDQEQTQVEEIRKKLRDKLVQLTNRKK